jgi:predicted O-methyltransferase YrrM
MDDTLTSLLRELEQFNVDTDARVVDRSKRMLNITPDTGPFLVLLVRALKAKHVLEIGTSNGYSTLWLAHAAQPHGGNVTTVEISSYKAEMAQQNFRRANLHSAIDLRLIDAGEFLKQQADGSFDFIFLDSYRLEYPVWWNDLHRVLSTGGLLVSDNAISHAEEMAGFVRIVERTHGCISSVVPVGHGQLVILKEE